MLQQTSRLLTRRDVYRHLLEKTVWVRSPIALERMSAFFLPLDTILRQKHTDSRIATGVEQMLQYVSECFPSYKERLATVPDNVDVDLYRQIIQQFVSKFEVNTLLFEGYAIDPKSEGEEFISDLSSRFPDLMVISPPASVVKKWNDKPFFRKQVATLLGKNALPPGKVISCSEESISCATRRMMTQSNVGQVILKIPGAGGSGNVIISRTDDLLVMAEKVVSVDKLFGRNMTTECLVEAWVPWEETICFSFFVTSSGDVISMEACAQMISKKTAGFMGGTSLLGVTVEEKEEIFKILSVVVRQMATEGMLGFLAIDVIVCDQSVGGVQLSSGRFIKLIETNMRVNGHNLECMLKQRIAWRDGIDPDTIAHMRLGAHAVGATNMVDARRMFASALSGIAREFSCAPLVAGNLYYIVLDNHGGGIPVSIYDSIMFFGYGCDKQMFSTAQLVLEKAGLLRE